MTHATNGHGSPGRALRPSAGSVRIAAAGDMHAHAGNREAIAEAFAALEGRADILLLAGDLTTHGEPEQGAILADACRALSMPVFAVLGNHDWHVNRAGELTEVLEDAGITVLERSYATPCVAGIEIGIVGAKGFVGGFPGSHLPDFGEPLMREVYAETTRDVAAVDAGLKAVAHCPVRIVLLHYAPTEQTLIGEPQTIWTMLGSDRLASPIAAHEPDLVLHGHAHAGTFQGAIDNVPVYNVSVPVMERDFWVFEVAGLDRATAPVH
jgi:Icc-related predicted phosphoesterase